jgi:hypothetical protein
MYHIHSPLRFNKLSVFLEEQLDEQLEQLCVQFSDIAFSPFLFGIIIPLFRLFCQPLESKKAPRFTFFANSTQYREKSQGKIVAFPKKMMYNI